MSTEAQEATLATLTRLDGKVAIVTGAGRGLGFEIVSRLSEAGAAVVVNDIDAQLADDAVERLTDLGRRGAAVVGSITEVDTAERMVETALRWGRVDIFVNNAAIFERTSFFDVTNQYWDRVMDINLRGPVTAMRVVTKQMIEQGDGGSIVNVLSTACVEVSDEDLLAYSASKSGLRQASRVLAKLMAPHGIRVNHVLPGGMATPGAATLGRLTSTPLSPGRRLHPDEVARAVYFFATDLSAMATGAEIVVDGGSTLE